VGKWFCMCMCTSACMFFCMCVYVHLLTLACVCVFLCKYGAHDFTQSLTVALFPAGFVS